MAGVISPAIFILFLFIKYKAVYIKLFNHCAKYDRMETVYFENGVKK